MANSNESKPTVVFVFNSTIPYNQHLCRRLAAEITDVAWHFVFTKPGGQWDEAWPENARLTFLWKDREGDDSVIPASEADKLVSEDENIGACILSGYASPFLRRLAKLCQQHQIPYFVRADSNIKGESRLPFWKKIVKRMAIKPILSNSAGSMPMGRMGKEYFATYGADRNHMFVVPHEPDHRQFERRDETAINNFMQANDLDSDRQFLLCCNRLVPVKRVDLVIDGFLAVADQFPKLDLLVLGQGPLHNELQARIPPKHTARIHWLGFRQLPEVITVFQLSDIFILASNYEPWATVIGEAAAAGLPIIASDAVGAAHEVITHGKSGWLFESENLHELIEGLNEMLPPDSLQDYKNAIKQDNERWRVDGDPVAGIADALNQRTKIDCAKSNDVRNG